MIFVALWRVLWWLWVVVLLLCVRVVSGLDISLLNNRDVARADVVEILAAALWVLTTPKRDAHFYLVILGQLVLLDVLIPNVQQNVALVDVRLVLVVTKDEILCTVRVARLTDSFFQWQESHHASL